jgi:D-amino-acid dehydrogenase
MQTDVIVLGAGMVGVSAAVHLKQKGKSVILVDRRGAGEETSYGNTGIIECDAFVPVGFPRKLSDLVRYAFNRGTEANYHLSYLPKAAPWLMRLRAHTDAAGIAAYARDIDPLGRRAVGEHRLMTAAAGAEHFVRHDGWLRLYRSEASWKGAAGLMQAADHYGAPYQVLSPNELADLEPHLKADAFHKAVLWSGTDTVSWPEGLVKAYVDLFLRLGGQFFEGDAKTLEKTETGWRVMAGGDWVDAPDVVVALGPWSLDVLEPLGYRFPLASKRGYHMHFGTKGNATLTRPICDLDYGYCLTPMQKGIRLTTGVEIADRDAPPTPRQLDQLKPIALAIFPLAEERDETPWLGRRPALPDSLPIIGPAGRHKGLWLDFGHGHLGFTQGPISGRLIAEQIAGEPTTVDVTPYRAERFN